ncbi:hypothetical protein ACFQZZ_17040 [Nocardia sp. GCM10030253]|uniref:hypothetical protein n=1 Tax=Nocardia sp. GCM10030253 TaxID=3273404 RepID=UPI00363B1180
MTDPQFQRPPYPAYAAAPQYPTPPPLQAGPSAVTAIFAAILAVLGGLRGVFGAIAIPFLNTDPDFDPTGFWRKIQILLLVAVVFAIVLLIGGISMFLRKNVARILIGVGGVGTLAISVITSVASYNHVAVDDMPVSVSVDLTLIGLIGVAFNVAMLVLTFLPSTSRWLAHQQMPR